MKSVRTLTTKKGSLLIEQSIALALFSVVFTALSLVIVSRQAFVQKLIAQREALFTAKENLEKADAHFIEYLTPCLALHTATSSTISFSKLVPDLTEAENLDYDCGGTFPLSFASSTLTSNTIPLSATSTALDIFHGFAYIAETKQSTTTLEIINVSTFHNPEFIASLTLRSTPPITKLDAIEHYIFLATSGNTKQFQIIDIHNQKHPSFQGSYTLPGVAGSFPGAISIFYSDKRVYVGTHRTAGHELHVYDVSSLPAIWLGSLELNHNLNAIAVKDRFVYLATSGNTKDMIVVDARIPASMKLLSTVDITGSEDAQTIFINGTTAYIGRKKSNINGNPDFIAVSVEEPATPKILYQEQSKNSIAGIRVINNFVFSLAKNVTTTLFIKDLFQTRSLTIDDLFVDTDFESNTLFTLTSKALTLTTLQP
jgi:hypothetical protein